MRNFFAGFALAALACACDPPEKYPPLHLGPPGSTLAGGSVCFQREASDGGWELVGLVDADGGSPARGSTARGYWYFPTDAKRVRVVPNCP